MPIRPHPTTYTCPQCKWSKTVAPRSDALGYGDVFRVCPVCGHAPLQNQKAGAAQAGWGAVADAIRRLWR
jgi:rubredoxin